MSGRSPEETARVNKHIREFIGDVPELLDVGCGDGSLLALMGAPRSVGVGPTEDECRILRARYPEITFEIV